MSTRNFLTQRQCFSTLFTIHNETFNVWSHLLPAIGFLLYSIHLFNNDFNMNTNLSYPLMCFAFGTCLMLFSSAFAHLFCCMSTRALHICFYIDYAAISVFAFTAGLGYIFYSRPLDEADTPDLFKNPYIFLTFSMGLSCMNLVVSCITWYHFTEYRALIRTGLYVEKFLFDISPFLVRCLLENCNPDVISIFKRHILWYAIAAVANGLQIPERFCPGVFDVLGNSHHFLHVFTALGNYDAFTVMVTDMIERKDELETTTYQPTVFNTFGLLVVLIIVNCSIVVWFVRRWLPTEEELFAGTKYPIIFKVDDSCEKIRSKKNL